MKVNELLSIVLLVGVSSYSATGELTYELIEQSEQAREHSAAEFEDEPTVYCGALRDTIQYGPITIAIKWTWNCNQGEPQPPTQPFEAQNYFKKKLIYQHGSRWVCFAADNPNPICHSYYPQSCPGDTCFVSTPD
jgi:hypothetical protein